MVQCVCTLGKFREEQSGNKRGNIQMIGETIAVNTLYLFTVVIAANMLAGFTWRKSYPKYLIAFLINIVCLIIINKSEVTILFLPIQIIQIVVTLELIYREKLKRTIGYVVIFTLIYAIAVQVIEAQLIAIEIVTGRKISQYFSIIDGTIALMIVLILSRIIKNTVIGTGRIKKKYVFILVSILFIDSVFLIEMGDYVESLTEHGHQFVSAVNYILIVVVILLQAIAIVYLISSRDVFKEREELTERIFEEQERHYEDLKQKEYKTRKFRHDIKNHMNLLAQLCKDDDIDKIAHYLDEININIRQFDNKIHTHNEIADAILNRYYDECADAGIELKVKGHFAENCPISTFDMCVILSNLLDNALQAEKEITAVDKKEISVTIRYTDNADTIILFENDIDKDIEIRNGKIKTTKKNRYHHGFGIENVRECVERYNGNISIEVEGRKFKVWINMVGSRV